MGNLRSTSERYRGPGFQEEQEVMGLQGAPLVWWSALRERAESTLARLVSDRLMLCVSTSVPPSAPDSDTLKHDHDHVQTPAYHP
jgi:hypothetical protein